MKIMHYFTHTVSQSSALPVNEQWLTRSLALVTAQLSSEIMGIMEEIVKLFGVLNEDIVKLQ